MAVDMITKEEQARANGLMWVTKTIGIALSLVIGMALLNN
jgi:PAT family beta-lactamase induction signal transducer AmpG